MSQFIVMISAPSRVRRRGGDPNLPKMPLIGHVKQVLVDSRERIGCEGSCSPDALMLEAKTVAAPRIDRPWQRFLGRSRVQSNVLRLCPLDQQTSQFVVSEHLLDGRRNRGPSDRTTARRRPAARESREYPPLLQGCSLRALAAAYIRRRDIPDPSSLNALGSARSPASANFEEARFAEWRIRMSRESAKRLACAVNQCRQHTCWARPAPREMPLHKKMQVLAEWDQIQRPEYSYLELPVQVHLRSDGQLPLSGGLSLPTSAALPIH